MAKRLLITGRVQGVYYRASFEQEAVRLGLRGWVRNRSDGAVEALVDGDPAAVDAIITWSRQGPPAARVDHVAIEDATSDSDTFTILPTQ